MSTAIPAARPCAEQVERLSPPVASSLGSALRPRDVLSWALALLLLALVVELAMRHADPVEVAALLRRASPEWLLAAVALQLGTYVASAEVYRMVLARLGHSVPLRSLVGLGLVRQLADAALPSAGLGGTLLVVRGLVRRSIPRAAAIGTVLVDLSAFYVGLTISLAAALVVLYVRADLHPAMLLLALVFVAVAIVVPSFALRLGDPGVAPRWLLRLGVVRRIADELAAAPREILRDRGVLARASALQLLVVVLDAATLWASLRALGADAALPTAYAAYVLATIAGVASILPAGLGVFEGGTVGTLVALAVDLEAAIAATLLLRALTLWLPLLPALLLVHGEARPARPPSAP